MQYKDSHRQVLFEDTELMKHKKIRSKTNEIQENRLQPIMLFENTRELSNQNHII
jgi:hypothetical protein